MTTYSKRLILTAALGALWTACSGGDEGASSAMVRNVTAENTPLPSNMESNTVLSSGMDKLESALGGSEMLANLSTLEVSATGARYLPYEGTRPEDDPVLAATTSRQLTVDLENDRLRVDYNRDIEFLFTATEEFSHIVDGQVGTTTQALFGTPLEELSSDRVAALRQQEVLLNPHLLFLALSEGDVEQGEDIALNGANHHLLTATVDGRALRLLVNAQSGELSRVETMENDFLMRDVVIAVEYSGWQSTADGVGYPSTLRLVNNGNVVLEQTVTEFVINPTLDEALFDAVEGVTPSLDEELYARGEASSQWFQLLDSIGIPQQGIDTLVTAVPVAEGVVQLQGASHHSLLIEQAEGLVLVDAPLYEDRGQALLDYLEAEYPGKPVTHVVASHFHTDHVSGIRQVLGVTNAALVVHEQSADFWSQVVNAPSTIVPDALAVSGRDVEILSVPDNGGFTLEDATHPVSLYDMNSEHANDLLLTHEQSTNTVFVVDVYSPGNAQQGGAAELGSAISANSIPTVDLKILGGHGPAMDDFATLQTFLP